LPSEILFPDLNTLLVNSRHLLLLLVCFFLVAGCNPFRVPEYEVKGRVVGFGSDGRTVIVEHLDVPGLMPAMTMPFIARDTAEVAALEYGDAVAFTLVITRDSSWIYGITELPSDAIPTAAATPLPDTGGEPFLQPADTLPTFNLVDQQNRPVQPEMYQGKALLVNFIYTQCPLPEFCPLLSSNFARLQDLVNERFPGQVHLLSVSIDPEHDTPDVLRDYAGRYSGDLSNWSFLTGPPEEIARVAHWFGIYYEPGTDGLDHSLATALVGPDGRVVEIWRGNRWTTDEVMAEISALLQPPVADPS
jgi:protein SCO1